MTPPGTGRSTPVRPSRQLTVYSKPGCHLCDDMKAVIDRVATRVPLDLQVIDISGDAGLSARYGLEIPVLLIDGRKAAKFRVTERELEEKLKRAAGGSDR